MNVNYIVVLVGLLSNQTKKIIGMETLWIKRETFDDGGQVSIICQHHRPDADKSFRLAEITFNLFITPGQWEPVLSCRSNANIHCVHCSNWNWTGHRSLTHVVC